MNRKTIFLHKLYEPLEKRILNTIHNAGYVIKNDYSREQYAQISKRLKRIFQRTNSYENKLINIWRLSQVPGVLIYCSNNEYLKFNESNMKRVVRKSRIQDDDLESLIIKGKIILYYGNSKFEGIEMFITEKRKIQLSEDAYYKSIEIFDESKLLLNTLNPFKDNVNVISIRNVSILSIIPRHLSSLDTIVNGIELFTSDGQLSEFVKPYLVKLRLISVFDTSDAVKVSSVDEVKINDKLVEPSIIDNLDDLQTRLLSEIRVKLNLNQYKSNYDRTIKYAKLIFTNRAYIIYTILQLPNVITFDSLDEKVLQNILLFSNADTIDIFKNDKDKPVIVKTLSKASSMLSNSMFSVAMSLRRTFKFDYDYSICIVCEKGAYKSKVISILNEYMTDTVIIDSDLYGKWISYSEEKKLNGDESIKVTFDQILTYPSYFETLMSYINKNTINDDMNKIDVFSRSYSTVLSSKVYGIQNFQDFIYNNCKTNKIVLFSHCTCEANLLSGHWQHVIIRPINNTFNAIISRQREDVEVQKLLYLSYKYMTSYGTRTSISFLELFMIICPEVINAISNKMITAQADLY